MESKNGKRIGVSERSVKKFCNDYGKHRSIAGILNEEEKDAIITNAVQKVSAFSEL